VTLKVSSRFRLACRIVFDFNARKFLKILARLIESIRLIHASKRRRLFFVLITLFSVERIYACAIMARMSFSLSVLSFLGKNGIAASEPLLIKLSSAPVNCFSVYVRD